jgi:2-oxoisovalerate dehydrogenase E1 component
MKGLMKASFLDPNPVVMLEHKGLYWSKVPGTELAKRPEPSRDYILPLGKAAVVLPADERKVAEGSSVLVITYGMGVYWAQSAISNLNGQVEIIDLRTLFPLDESLIIEKVKLHNKVMILTEEPVNNGFAQALAGKIQQLCFTYLDAPIIIVGAENLPAIPLNATLEHTMLPNADKVKAKLVELLAY